MIDLNDKYEDRFVALIFFGKKHEVISDNSGDPTKRRINYDVYCKLVDLKENKLLFKKRFDVFSSYYVRNEKALSKAIISEIILE